jgi:hypothetical protein
MSFHRFDSSVETSETVAEHTFASPNALRGVSERLRGIHIERLSGIFPSQLFRTGASGPAKGRAKQPAPKYVPPF